MAITAKMVQSLREKTGLGMMDCKKALVEADGDMELAIENLRKKGQATAAKRAGKTATEGRVCASIDGATGVIFEVNCETDFVANSNDFSEFVEKLSAVLLREKPETVEAINALTADEFAGSTIAEATAEVTGKVGEKVVITNYTLLQAGDNEALFNYVHNNSKIASIVKLSGTTVSLSDEAVDSLGKDIAMHISAVNPVAVSKDDFPEAVIAKEKEIYVEQIMNEGKPAEMAEKIAIGKLNKFYKDNALLEQEFIKADKKRVADVLAQHGDLTVVSFVSLILGSSQAE